MKRVVMYIKDRDNTIEELLKYIKKLTDDGHGFTVDVDIDDKEYKKHFYIDGDGSDKIRDLIVEDGWTQNSRSIVVYERRIYIHE